MPTGYTSKLYNGEDQTFTEFAWDCARAFGALILMRDDPADAPIPERFEPSDHHVTKLAEAEQALAEFEAMTDNEHLDLFLAEGAENVRQRIEAKRKSRDLAERYQAMLWKVETWEPPTPEHRQFREFMIEQLKSSIDFDCNVGTDVYPPRLPDRIEDWYTAKIEKLRWSVDYHRRSLAEEIERTEERNRWVGALRESLDGSRV